MNAKCSDHARLTVIDTASPDMGKHGTCKACDEVKKTCLVLLDGETSAKTFRWDQVSAESVK